MKPLAGEHSVAAMPDVKNSPAIATETRSMHGANDSANGSSAAQITSEAETPGSGSTDATNERFISMLQGCFADLAKKTLLTQT
ncbi:hypothetical protein DFH09DRAFT_1271450, partial [Mycena vulgaris]